jgi:hypothetical protein
MDFLRKRLDSLIDGIILAIVLGTGAAVWSIISKLPQPIIFVVGISTLAAVLVVWNQLGVWRERHKKKLSKYSEQELETAIHQWVDIPAFSFKRLEAEQNLYYKYLITDNFGHQVIIIRDKNDASVIQIISDMTIDVPGGSSLSQSDWKKVANKVSLELARLGVEYVFNGTPNQFERVRIIEPVIIDDSLTGFYFRQRILFVVRALILIAVVANDALREMGFSEQKS